MRHSFRWVRQFIFVKPDKPEGSPYLVVADQLLGNRELEAAFNF